MDAYLQNTRRKRSEEYDASCSLHISKLSDDSNNNPHKSKVSQAPINITRNQKLLKTGLLSRQGGPLFYKKLELNIPQMKYNLKSCCPSSSSKDVIMKQVDQKNAKEKTVRNRKDKWRGWNKQLQCSLNYWQRRFPCADMMNCSHKIR